MILSSLIRFIALKFEQRMEASPLMFSYNAVQYCTINPRGCSAASLDSSWPRSRGRLNAHEHLSLDAVAACDAPDGGAPSHPRFIRELFRTVGTYLCFTIRKGGARARLASGHQSMYPASTELHLAPRLRLLHDVKYSVLYCTVPLSLIQRLHRHS